MRRGASEARPQYHNHELRVRDRTLEPRLQGSGTEHGEVCKGLQQRPTGGRQQRLGSNGGLTLGRPSLWVGDPNRKA
jgi:hypothetical protein